MTLHEGSKKASLGSGTVAHVHMEGTIRNHHLPAIERQSPTEAAERAPSRS